MISCYINIIFVGFHKLIDDIHFVVHRFDVNQKCFFTAAIRSRIVQFILDRKRFTLAADDDYAFGIDRLINEEAYLAAYPLHDVTLSLTYNN